MALGPAIAGRIVRHSRLRPIYGDHEKSPGPVPMSVATMVKPLMLETEFNALKRQRLKLPPALPNGEAVYEGAFNPKPVERGKRRFGSCR